MEYFISEILESEEAKNILISCGELAKKAKKVAEYIFCAGVYTDLKDEEALCTLAYMAEYVREKNAARGICEEITIATLKDINIWIDNYLLQHGKFGIDKFGWLINHYRGNLFRIGRLQFILRPSDAHIPSGDFVLDTHIPQGEPLDISECEKAFLLAGDFFKNLYPQYDFQYFYCYSWLLDENLQNFLSDQTNLVRFMKLWTKYTSEKNMSSIIERVFGFGMTREKLQDAVLNTGLQINLKKYLDNGGLCRDSAGYKKI